MGELRVWRLLGDVEIRAWDLRPKGCECDSGPYTAGLVLGWVTVYTRVNHLSIYPVT